MFGFRIVLPSFFPFSVPICYLDEKEDPQLVEFLDYIDPGNKLSLNYLDEWEAHYQPGNMRFNLQQLLIEINGAYIRSPPISFSEFGGVEHDFSAESDLSFAKRESLF